MKLHSDMILRDFIKLFSPILLVVILVTTVLYQLELKAQLSSMRTSEYVTVKQQQDFIRNEISHIISDLRVLSKMSSLQHYSVQSEPSRKLIEDDFFRFMSSTNQYDKIRLIDVKGMEKVRVDWNSGDPEVISPSKLQNKQARYYFSDTMDLDIGDIFVSPFDLSVEHDQIEQPLKPIIRFATPVTDVLGNKVGILIINYQGQYLLEQLGTLHEKYLSNILLLNEQGFYLRGLKNEDEWTFMYPQKSHINFPAQFSTAWNVIAQKNDGQFFNNFGLFSFTTIYPLAAEEHLSSGHQNDKEMAQGDYQWKLVSFLPADQIHLNSWGVYLMSDVLILSLIGLFIWKSLLANMERIEAEQSLLEEKEKFRLVADYTYDWEYWLGTDGHYIYISPACERISGYSADEFIKKPDLFMSLVHPDDLSMVQTHWVNRQSEEQLYSMTFRIINIHGQLKWIEKVCQPVYGQNGEFLGRRGHNSDITLRKEAEIALEKLATHDDLTNLPNRALLYDRLTVLIAHAARENTIFGILFIDLDSFKEINDEYGHEAGDMVLVQTAEKMTRILRKSDTVARIGGDEFIVVLPDIKDSDTSYDIAQKLIDIINQPISLHMSGRIIEQSVGASIGISIYPSDGQTIDNLISSADKSMYQAKKTGKNHYCRITNIPG